MMPKTFIVKETITRTWRVEVSKEFMEMIAEQKVSSEETRLLASDFTSDPNPSRATVILLAASHEAETEEE